MIIKLLFYALLLIWPSVLLSDSKIDKYNFSIQFSNLSIAKISATVNKNENKILYSIVSSSDGSLKSFYKFSSTIKGQSKRIRDKLFPSIYETFSSYKGKTRKSYVEWNNSNNVFKFQNTPKLDLKKVNKIPQNTIFNVIDPFTALINTIDNLQLNNSCINKFRVFDGRRRYDLEMIELSRSFLKKDRPKTYEGNVIVCGLRFYPIGGHYLDSKWKPENDKFSDIKLYFGFLNKKVFPVRMEINRWFGSIITRIIFT